jgi:malonyl-CoA/methylmalonyl-CoA synthetase
MPRVASPLLARLVAHPIATDVAVIGYDGVTGGAGTYGAIFARARGLSSTLRAGRPTLGGARVALLAQPGRPWVDALLAILLAGGCAVPLSPLHTDAEITHAIEATGPVVLITTRELAPRLEAHRDGRRLLLADDRHTPPHGREAEVAAEDDALVLFTSGTTGKPKAVVHTHQGLAATLSALEEAWRWRRDDRLLHVLPLHHTHGVVVALLGALWAGATARLAPSSPFDAAVIWELFGESTVFMAVPTMHYKLMEAFRAADAGTQARWRANAGKLRLMTSGSAALPASLLGEIAAATGQTILERYGMTEIGMALSNRYDGPRVPGAVGVPLSGVEVDVCDEEGRAVPAGELGELRVRSTQMFRAYLGDEAATAAAFDAEGRFLTGDTGTRDADGTFRLLGRTSSDILKSGGYKLSALEIEDVVRQHPAVAEVAVIGLPDETWGDRVTACVVARAGQSLTIDELRAFAKEQLAPYKVPRQLELIDALPRNPMGKVQKKELRARFA